MNDETYVVVSDAECPHCSDPLTFLKADSGEIVAHCDCCQGIYVDPDSVDMDRQPPKLNADGSVSGLTLHIRKNQYAQPEEIQATEWYELMGDQMTLKEFLESGD